MALLQTLRNTTGKITGGLLLLYATACRGPAPDKARYTHLQPRIITKTYWDSGVILASARDDGHIDYLVPASGSNGIPIAVDTLVEKRFNDDIKKKFQFTPFIMDEKLRYEAEQYAAAQRRFAYYLDSTIYAQEKAYKKAH